jgi:hypothetical protein
VYFWGQFCDVTKVGIIRRKDLAKLGYNKQDMKIIFKKNPSIFLATSWKQIYNSGDFLIFFQFRILAIKNHTN